MVHGRFSIYFSYKNEIRPLICWKASPLPTGKLLCGAMETFFSQEKDDLKKKKNEFHPLGIWLFFSHRTSWLILGKKLKLRPPYFRDAFMACSCWLGTYKKKKKSHVKSPCCFGPSPKTIRTSISSSKDGNLRVLTHRLIAKITWADAQKAVGTAPGTGSLLRRCRVSFKQRLISALHGAPRLFSSQPEAWGTSRQGQIWDWTFSKSRPETVSMQCPSSVGEEHGCQCSPLSLKGPTIDASPAEQGDVSVSSLHSRAQSGSQSHHVGPGPHAGAGRPLRLLNQKEHLAHWYAGSLPGVARVWFHKNQNPETSLWSWQVKPWMLPQVQVHREEF